MGQNSGFGSKFNVFGSSTLVCMVGRMDELVTFGQGDLTEQDSVGQGEEE